MADLTRYLPVADSTETWDDVDFADTGRRDLLDFGRDIA